MRGKPKDKRLGETFDEFEKRITQCSQSEEVLKMTENMLNNIKIEAKRISKSNKIQM